MPMTIYLISFSSDSKFNVSTDYATDEKGIKQLALDWYWTDWDGEKIPVHVNLNMDKMQVSVYDKADIDFFITYDIITFVRGS